MPKLQNTEVKLNKLMEKITKLRATSTTNLSGYNTILGKVASIKKKSREYQS